MGSGWGYVMRTEAFDKGCHREYDEFVAAFAGVKWLLRQRKRMLASHQAAAKSKARAKDRAKAKLRRDAKRRLKMPLPIANSNAEASTSGDSILQSTP